MKKIILLSLVLMVSFLKASGQCTHTYTNANFPTGSLVIQDNHVVCIDQSVTVSGYTTISIYNGGVLKIRNGATFNLTGTITVNPGAEINIDHCNSKIELDGTYSGGGAGDCEFKVYCNSCGSNPLSSYFTATGSVAFLDFCCFAGILPVELIYFEAQKNEFERSIQYNWSTASESNNNYFEILVSNDGRRWDVLSRIPGKGNSSEINDYVFESSDLSNSYAKLKQVDFDGKESYSDIITLATDSPDITYLSNSIIINTKREKQLEIYSISGLLLYHKTIPIGTSTVNLDDLSDKGIVIVKIDTHTKKIFLN